MPRQGRGASKAEHRRLSTALLSTPPKEPPRYRIDWDWDGLAEPVRGQAWTLGRTPESDGIAVTDGGNGLEEAWPRPRAEKRTTIRDGYPGVEPLCAFAKRWLGRQEAACRRWQQAQALLDEQGGEGLLAFLPALNLPPWTLPEVSEELGQRLGYLESNGPCTDYPP